MCGVERYLSSEIGFRRAGSCRDARGSECRSSYATAEEQLGVPPQDTRDILRVSKHRSREAASRMRGNNFPRPSAVIGISPKIGRRILRSSGSTTSLAASLTVPLHQSHMKQSEGPCRPTTLTALKERLRRSVFRERGEFNGNNKMRLVRSNFGSNQPAISVQSKGRGNCADDIDKKSCDVADMRTIR